MYQTDYIIAVGEIVDIDSLILKIGEQGLFYDDSSFNLIDNKLMITTIEQLQLLTTKCSYIKIIDDSLFLYSPDKFFNVKIDHLTSGKQYLLLSYFFDLNALIVKGNHIHNCKYFVGQRNEMINEINGLWNIFSISNSVSYVDKQYSNNLTVIV